MALEIFKLVGSIFVDNSAANESLAKTDEKASNVGGTLLKGVGTAAKWGAAIVTGATAAVTAVGGLALKVSDTAGEIADASTRAGVSAEEYQKWAYAAKLSGMEAETLEKAMIKQQKAFSDAKEGAAGVSEAYQRMGIDISQIDDSGEAFNQVMDKLASMEDATERNALANDIFGKSYAELAPMLASGSQGIEDMKNQAVELGAVMSNEAVKSGEEFGDKLDSLKASFGGMVNQLGAGLIPILSQVLDIVMQNLPMIQEMFATLAPTITGLLQGLLPPLMELISTILPIAVDMINQLLPFIVQIAQQILPIIVNLITTIIPPIMQLVSALLPPLMAIISAVMPILTTLINLLTPILNLIISILEPIVNLIATAITPIITVLAELINTILTPLQPIIEMIASLLTGVLGAAFEALSPIINSITGIFKGLIDFVTGIFSGNWKKAWDGIVGIFSGIFEGLGNIVKAPLNFIIGCINKVFSAIGTIKIPDWVPLIGGASFSLPQIPLLAQGGDVREGGKAIINEAGAELVDLPSGARVTPLTKGGGSDIESLFREMVTLMRILIERFPELVREGVEGTKIEYNDRELGRLINNYAR